MKKFTRGFGLALVLFIWTFALYFFAAALVSWHLVPTRLSGIFQDTVVLIGVAVFNRLIAHVPIFWWNHHNGWAQLRQAVPALLIVGLLLSANLPRVLSLPFSGLILLYVGFILLVGLTEEYVFRGVMIPLLARSFPGHNFLVVFLSSALFGGLHLMNSTHLSLTYVLPQILFAMAIGTLFASLYIRTHNLGITILLHAATDTSLISQLIDHPTSSANLNFPARISFIVAGVYGVLLVLALIVAWRQTRHATVPTER